MRNSQQKTKPHAPKSKSMIKQCDNNSKGREPYHGYRINAHMRWLFPKLQNTTLLHYSAVAFVFHTQV